jgi:hypothetical protein
MSGTQRPLGAPQAVVPLSGDEEFAPGLTVRDFWSWSFSDLRLNTTRGLLAQFLVARALGDDRPTDEGWGNYDVRTPAGIRVEVKAAGYLQSWQQLQPSRISFSRLTGIPWSEIDGSWGTEREIRADVFVFAVHTCVDHALYDALHLPAWQFYVVPAPAIQALGVRSIGLERVRELAGEAVDWSGLSEAVAQAISVA